MNKVIKWILIIIAGTGILLSAILISLPFIIDPNDYKEQIGEIVHEQTGRELSIPGDIKLNVSTKLDVTFSLGEIQMASSKDFPNASFASSKLVEIKLAIWPLVTKKQLQINNIALGGVQLNLIRNNEGKTNWEDLAGRGTSRNDKSLQPKKDKTKQSSKKGLASIDIGGVEIKDINVQYQDQQTNKTIALNHFNLTIGHLQESKPFPVSADFDFSMDDSKQPVTANIETRFDLTLNLSKQHFIINNFDLNGLFQGAMFPSSKLEINIMADADVSVPDEEVIIHKLIVKQSDLMAEIAVSFKGFKTPAIKGTLKVSEYSPQNHLSQLGIFLPKFTDPTVLHRLSANLGFNLNSDQLEIKDILIQLDDTIVKANAVVNNVKQPSYTLNLHVDQLDLDRYAIKKDPQAPGKDKGTEQETGGKQEATIPVHLLRGLTFNADIKVDTLKVAKLTLTEVTVKADGKDGLIQLQPFSAKLYDGSLSVTGQVDARPDIPKMDLKESLQGVQLGPLFVDMVGKEEITGRADITANVETRGIDTAELTRNSNGKIKLSLSDGKIAKLQILEIIRVAKALLSKESITASAASQPTGFATLTASGTLTNGVFQNNDLQAASDLMVVTGKGTVDLVEEYINYLLTINLTDRVERKQDTGLVDLGNIPIPYRIKGNFNELQQSAAIKELVKAQAKEILFDTLEKQFGGGTDEKEKTGTDAGSLINKGLKGLFGN